MKSIKNLAEFIEKSNVLFEAMSKDEKKIQIAKDCIQRILVGQLEPLQGAIVSYRTMCTLRANNKSLSIKEIINEDDFPTCQVCAKGGLFMSYVGRVNEFSTLKLTTDSADHYNSCEDNEHKKLLEIFGARELAEIEYAFEGRQCLMKDENGENILFDQTEFMRIMNFKKRYFDADERLIAICKNIIRNKGTFKLSKHYNNKKSLQV